MRNLVIGYFASSAETTLSLPANKAKLLYFRYCFVNYVQSTPRFDTFQIVIILLHTVYPPKQQLLFYN